MKNKKVEKIMEEIEIIGKEICPSSSLEEACVGNVQEENDKILFFFPPINAMFFLHIFKHDITDILLALFYYKIKVLKKFYFNLISKSWLLINDKKAWLKRLKA